MSAEKTVYEFQAKDITGKDISLDGFKGKVMTSMRPRLPDSPMYWSTVWKAMPR